MVKFREETQFLREHNWKVIKDRTQESITDTFLIKGKRG
jgi:hypothetical protein